MWIKVLIIVLLIAVIASLGSSLYYLFSDLGERKRTLYALGIRITLAALLLGAIAYGFLSGELTVQAPWHGRY